MDDLGGEVVGGSHTGFGLGGCLCEDLCDAEVANLDDLFGSQEHILALQVPMNDLPIVDMLHPQANLSEPVQDLRLLEILAPLFFDLAS